MAIDTFGGLYGLSPRGRGKPLAQSFGDDYAGSIPAWAGETGDARHHWAQTEVYPRVGGGNPTS